MREQRQTIESLQKNLMLADKSSGCNESARSRKYPARATPALPYPAWSPTQPITVARAGSAYMNISSTL